MEQALLTEFIQHMKNTLHSIRNLSQLSSRKSKDPAFDKLIYPRIKEEVEQNSLILNNLLHYVKETTPYPWFFGFSEKPFEDLPDPKFVFLTPGHRDAIGLVTESIRNRKGPISITGDVGTGKTTLIHFLLHTLDEKVKKVFLFHTSITFEELIRTILLNLSLEVADKSGKRLLEQLEAYLFEKLAEDEIVLVLIDEAQGLSEEAMFELGKLFKPGSRIADRLQIIFVGQPEFEHKLSSSRLQRLNRAIGLRREMRALDDDESMKYIDYRLKLVGSRSSRIFTPKAAASIIHYAQGVPRVINALCDHALHVGYGLSRRRIDEDIVHKVITDMEGKTFKKHFPGQTSQLSWLGRRLSFQSVLVILLIVTCLGGMIWIGIRTLERKSVNRADSTLSSSLITSQPSLAVRLNASEPRGTDPSASTPKTLGRASEELRKIVKIREGQTISSLAETYYGMASPTLIDLILDFNPEVTNVHLIQINQEIRIPEITDKLWIIRFSDNTYKVHAGTFQNIEDSGLYEDQSTFGGKEIEIVPRKVSPEDTWYRVMLGKCNNPAEAQELIHLLKGKGLLPYARGGSE